MQLLKSGCIFHQDVVGTLRLPLWCYQIKYRFLSQISVESHRLVPYVGAALCCQCFEASEPSMWVQTQMSSLSVDDENVICVRG